MNRKIEAATRRINHLRAQRKPGESDAVLEQVIFDAEAQRARLIYLEDEAKKPLPDHICPHGDDDCEICS